MGPASAPFFYEVLFMEFDYQVLRLTDAFYDAYPPDQYCELLEKEGRQYNCLLIQSHYGYFICIPFRSHISHPWAFLFRRSERSKRSRSGLDYSKIIIVAGNDQNSYLDTKTALVDQDEFIEMRDHIDLIAMDAQNYIDGYFDYVRESCSGSHKKSDFRKYQYSTLAYFHKELGIPV